MKEKCGELVEKLKNYDEGLPTKPEMYLVCSGSPLPPTE
jgi:hypothetical protein